MYDPDKYAKFFENVMKKFAAEIVDVSEGLSAAKELSLRLKKKECDATSFDSIRKCTDEWLDSSTTEDMKKLNNLVFTATEPSYDVTEEVKRVLEVVRTMDPPDPAWGEAAVDAVKDWLEKPALIIEENTRVLVNVHYHFREFDDKLNVFWSAGESVEARVEADPTRASITSVLSEKDELETALTQLKDPNGDYAIFTTEKTKMDIFINEVKVEVIAQGDNALKTSTDTLKSLVRSVQLEGTRWSDQFNEADHTYDEFEKYLRETVYPLGKEGFKTAHEAVVEGIKGARSARELFKEPIPDDFKSTENNLCAEAATIRGECKMLKTFDEKAGDADKLASFARKHLADAEARDITYHPLMKTELENKKFKRG